MLAIHGKLHALKSEVRKWERKKKMNMIKDFADIKKELEKIGRILDVGNPFPKLINNIREME